MEPNAMYVVRWVSDSDDYIPLFSSWTSSMLAPPPPVVAGWRSGPVE